MKFVSEKVRPKAFLKSLQSCLVDALRCVQDRPAVEGLVVGTRVNGGWARTVINLFGGHRRRGVAVVSHHLVLIRLQVHLLLIGHEVGDGERVVEIVVGVHGLQVVLQIQVLHWAGQ